MATSDPTYQPRPVLKAIRQSPPVDLTKPYDITWIKGKHILITGGASGFGAAWAKKWGSAGASLILADINTRLGTETVARLRQETSNANIWFIQVDVTDWKSQVALFKEAVKLSPHGGIDCVVASAGIAEIGSLHDPTYDFSVDDPPAPNLKCMDVCLTGVIYTTQLALWWLARNPGSEAASPDYVPGEGGTAPRDRHLLLVSSVAGLGPLLMTPIYSASKHGVLGLFRSLRGCAFLEGVRTNILFPYFIETPINPAIGRALVAGGNMGSLDDVVDAGSRLVADSSICGRGLAVAPRARVKQDEGTGEWNVLPFESEEGNERGIWEIYAHDFEDSDMATRRLVVILNKIAALQGWIKFFYDMFKAGRYGILGW